MRILSLIVLLAFAFIRPSYAEIGPSFDCSKAHTKIETLICAKPYLARLDVELASAYRSALSAGKIEPRSQIDWIGLNQICLSATNMLPEDCLLAHYQQRISDLKSDRMVWPLPSLTESRKVCDYVAGRGPA